MKKVISILLVFILAMSTVPVLANETGEKLTWSYVDETMYIMGKGALPDFGQSIDDRSPVASHHAKKIVVDEGVESIGAFTFMFCEVESITLPSTLKKIGKCAFYGCENLKEINLPEGLEEIDNMAFMDCHSLKKVIVPDSVTTLFGAVFLNCTSLEELKISDNVEFINSGLFDYCENLKKLEIGKNVRGENLNFNDVDNIEEIIVHEENPSYKAVDNVLFNKSMTTLIKHPKKDAGEYKVPESVTNVMLFAFMGCENMTITLPEAVDEYSFRVKDSVRLTNEKIESGYTKATYMGDEIFYTSTISNRTLTIHRVNDLNGDNKFALPPEFSGYEDGEIKKAVFSFDGIENVDATALEKLPERMFADINVKSVALSDNLKEISGSLFAGCSLLGEIKLPKALEKISSGAFYDCTNLKYVDLPEGLKEIGNGAFAYSGLKSITIPSTVTFIGQKAFSNIPTLSRIVIKEGDLKVLDDDNYPSNYKTEAFNNLNDNVDVYIPSNVEYFTDNLFKGCYAGYKGGTVWTQYPQGLTIYAPKGSFAEQWAVKNGVNYAECEKMPEEPSFREREEEYNKWFSWREFMAASINKKTETDYGTIVEWATFNSNDLYTYITYVRYDGESVSITSFSPMLDETQVKKYKSIEISEDGKTAIITYPEIKNAGTFIVTVDLVNCMAKRDIIPYVEKEPTEEETAVDTEIGSGKCGVESEENGEETLNWEYANGTLTISGTGDMKDFFMERGGRVQEFYSLVRPWNKFNDKIKKIVIKTGVKSISRWAFEECVNLEEVVIEDNVKVNMGAFHYLKNIEKVTLGKNCTLEKNAFMFCTSLKSITLPEGTVVNEGAFSYCYALREVTFEGENINMQDSSFANTPAETGLQLKYN